MTSGPPVLATLLDANEDEGSRMSLGTDMPIESISFAKFEECCLAGIGIDCVVLVEVIDVEDEEEATVVVGLVVLFDSFVVFIIRLLDCVAVMVGARPVVGVTLPAAEPVFCFLT